MRIKQLEWTMQQEQKLIQKYGNRKLTDTECAEACEMAAVIVAKSKNNETVRRRILDVIDALDVESMMPD